MSQADIERLLGDAPGLTVALYASLPQDLVRGALVIVAAGGRVAHNDNFTQWLGIGNVVDIPALEWLCRQAEPRIWISDGQITGVADKPGRNLLRDLERIVQRGRIRRFPSIRDWLTAPRGSMRQTARTP